MPICHTLYSSRREEGYLTLQFAWFQNRTQRPIASEMKLRPKIYTKCSRQAFHKPPIRKYVCTAAQPLKLVKDNLSLLLFYGEAYVVLSLEAKNGTIIFERVYIWGSSVLYTENYCILCSVNSLSEAPLYWLLHVCMCNKG